MTTLNATGRPILSSPELRRALGAAAVLVIGLAIVTWPYASVLSRGLPRNIDPMFSIWRLSWFAHALRAHLPIANGNIFYPEKGTFALSDTIILLDILAAPLLWAGISKVLVYNALLAVGMVASGLALFMALRALRVASEPALVGAAIFTLAPYRIEHIIHLELQWLSGSVAAIASIVLLAVRPSARAGLALAGSLVFQLLTCIYYAVFLLPPLGAIWLTCVPFMRNPARTATLTMFGVLLAGLLISPVALLHLEQRLRVGNRQLDEVQTFSARPADHLATPDENRLYGRPTNEAAVAERRLFPGSVALALAMVGLFSRRRRCTALMVMAVTVLAIDLSFGTNGVLYPILYRWLTPWQGLRAPSRYGAYVLMGISVLAALGWERLLECRPRPSGWRLWWPLERIRPKSVLTALILAALCVEYQSPQQLWQVGPTPAVYAMINALPRGVVLEYPTPSPDSIPWIDVDYAFWSTTHWRPLINGYSCYLPASFWQRAARYERFPSDDTVAELCALDVRYVVVHPWVIEQPRRAQVLQQLALRNEMTHLGSFRDWLVSADLFEISAHACRSSGHS